MVTPTDIKNPCIICGKQRIVVSKSSEMVGNSLAVSREMVCPDAECQKKLDKRLDEEQRKRESYKQSSIARKQGAQKNKASK